MHEHDAAEDTLEQPAPSHGEVVEYIYDMLLDLTGLAFGIGEAELGGEIADLLERRMLADRLAREAAPGPRRRTGSLS